jgi:hypothetical protein
MADQWYWYHTVLSTYGSWLYGEERGFRTRHHREHIEGDYKNPPPIGMYADKKAHSERLLKHDPIVLSKELRSVVGAALRERLRNLGSLVLCLSVSGQHIHILSKIPFGKNRWWMGLAKRHVWFVLRDRGWKTKLWAKRSKSVLIKDRQHQLNAFYYILRHVREGAWVWSLVPRDISAIS